MNCSTPGHGLVAATTREEKAQPPAPRTASSRAAIPPAMARPAIQPQNVERATVAFARSPWKSASKAASLRPQRCRQMDSPTAQAKKASIARHGTLKTTPRKGDEPGVLLAGGEAEAVVLRRPTGR